MLSKFFGKRDQPAEAPTDAEQPAFDLDVPTVRQELDTVWDVPQLDSTPPPPPASPSPAPPIAPVTRVAQVPLPTLTANPVKAEVDVPLPIIASGIALGQTALQRKNTALDVVGLHHQRIANTIRTLWGYKECSVYINKLIMAGGDGMGHARVGFNQEAVQAMLVLSDLHDAEFGPPDSIPGALSF